MDSMRQLQKIQFGSGDQENRELYYTADQVRLREGREQKDHEQCCSVDQAVLREACLVLLEKGKINFGSYYNSFSAGKWKTYTTVPDICLAVKAAGSFRITLWKAVCRNGNIEKCKIWEEEVTCESGGQWISPVTEVPEEGILYPEFVCKSKNGALKAISYCTSQMPQREIHLALDLCTFCREEEVKNNLERLRRSCWDNPASNLFRNLQIYLVDNGQTLEGQIDTGQIHYYSNPNVGGTGGFTRGLMEIQKNAAIENITHMVFMDDDAEFIPASLELMQSFLEYISPEYEEYALCGALMRREMPYIQTESGAWWEDGFIECRHANYDMRLLENVVLNELEEEEMNYSGWWFSCIPLEVTRQLGLPLPLFIHRDDVEYGLRLKQKMITLNGISIRHESYDTKLSQATEYYDVRNMGIVESIHNPHFNKKLIRKSLIRCIGGNALRCRYKYAMLNILGVMDFLKGADWLLEQDCQMLHKEISAWTYKMEKKEKLPTDAFFKSIERDQRPLLFKIGLVMKSPFRSGSAQFPPWQSVYDYMAYGNVCVVDCSGNSIQMERNWREALRILPPLFRCMRQLNRQFETARRSYIEQYEKLISKEQWVKNWSYDR